MKLSVLDQMPIREGGHPADPVNEAIELAQSVEQWGYHRYWTAQFHGTHSFTSAAPELVACRLAAATTRLRIGAGGILVNNVSPYVVAEQFKLLETMFPGRIDLGMGRVPGANDATHQALLYGSPLGVDYFSQKVADIKAFMAGTPPLNPAWRDVRATPVTDHQPELWLLGSGGSSAVEAAKHGLALCFAHFIEPYAFADVLEKYRRDFQPSSFYAKPQASLSVYVICFDTEAEALRQRASRDLWWVGVFKGGDPKYASPETGLAYAYSAAELERLAIKRDAVVIGTPGQVHEQLLALAAKAGVDELVIQTMCYDFAVRKRSFQLLAEVFRTHGMTG